MGKRIRLGLVYLWDKKWMGGMYYTQNLIIALNSLDDEKKPLINLYCKEKEVFDELNASVNYPYLECTIIKVSHVKRLLRKLLSFLSQAMSSRINSFEINPNDDVLYPYSNGKDAKKLVYWRPDFQEKHLPEFFSKTDIFLRDRAIKEVCMRHIPIVFSSLDCKNDFQRFFPQYADNPSFVVRFAVNQPEFSHIDIDVIKQKYGIKKSYFFCANQFWMHKNHFLMFKAFKNALDMGMDMQLVCTGRMSDTRNLNYISELNNYIKTNNLSSRVLTLGMIDKLELLCLMKNSYAVIQPSLFEGWNTTVEDCKAMSKFIFLSDLPVHREQASKNVCFFNPYDWNDLSCKLLHVIPNEEHIDYSKNIKRYGEDFYNVISNC